MKLYRVLFPNLRHLIPPNVNEHSATRLLRDTVQALDDADQAEVGEATLKSGFCYSMNVAEVGLNLGYGRFTGQDFTGFAAVCENHYEEISPILKRLMIKHCIDFGNMPPEVALAIALGGCARLTAQLNKAQLQECAPDNCPPLTP